MRWLGVGALSALAMAMPLGASGEKAPPPAVVPLNKVLDIALRDARFDGDAHPTEIVIAKGRLVVALKVSEPEVTTTPAGLRSLEGANSLVYLVAMHGRFVFNGPVPFGRRAPHGRVLELVIDAHTGFVESLSLYPKVVPVPLSRLGPVTRLRCGRLVCIHAPSASGNRAERVPLNAHGFASAGCPTGAPIPSVAYDLGTSFEGLPRRSLKKEQCNSAAPRGVPVVSGPSKAIGFVSIIYGRCDTSEGGCSPPLDVESWPECARNPNSYKPSPHAQIESGEPELNPSRKVRLSAAPWIPAASFERGTRIELYTGQTTIVVFANDAGTATRAANALARGAEAEAPFAAARTLRSEANQPGDAGACHHLLT